MLSSKEACSNRTRKPKAKHTINTKVASHSLHDLLMGGRSRRAEKQTTLHAKRPCVSSRGIRSWIKASSL